MKFKCALCGFTTTDAKEAGEHAYLHMVGKEHASSEQPEGLPEE